MFATHNAVSRPSAPIASRRKVFANAMVAHVWAQQTNSDGRSANGNFYFEGDTIYSYGRHFPIARFTDNSFRGERVVLMSNESRSVSTSGHQRYTSSALNGLPVKVFHVPHIEDHGHTRNVVHFVAAFASHVAEMAKPAKKHYLGYDGDNRIADNAANRIATLASYQDDLQDYCGAFAIDCPALDIAGASERITVALAKFNDPKAVAKRVASAAKRKSLAGCSHIAAVLVAIKNGHDLPRMTARDIEDGVAAWIDTGHAPVALAPLYESISLARWNGECEEIAKMANPDMEAIAYNLNYLKPKRHISAAQWQAGEKGSLDWSDSAGDTMVRRVGDTLETSRGASCPFKHSVVAFVKAQQCRATGLPWHKNGEQIRVGVFTVDKIDIDGNMVAGCHTLNFEEMQRLAIQEVPHLVKARFPLPAVI